MVGRNTERTLVEILVILIEINGYFHGMDNHDLWNFNRNLPRCIWISQTPFDLQLNLTLHHSTIRTSHSHLSIPHSNIIIFLFSITMSPPAKNKERASTGRSRKTSASRCTRQSKRVAVDTREAASRTTRSRSQPAEKDSRTSQQRAESKMKSDMQRRSSQQEPHISDEDNSIVEAGTPQGKKAKFATFEVSNPVPNREASPPPPSCANGSRSRLTFNPDATYVRIESQPRTATRCTFS